MDVFLKPKSLKAPSLAGFETKAEKPKAAAKAAKAGKAAQGKAGKAGKAAQGKAAGKAAPLLEVVEPAPPLAKKEPIQEPDPKSFAEAYKRACFSRPQPPEEHLDMAVQVLCCSLQFSWEVGFWIVVDELFCTGKAFLERNAKLLKILQTSRGKSKGKEKAQQIWNKTRDKFKYELQIYVQLYRQPDPLLAYLRYRLALVNHCHLGLPIEF